MRGILAISAALVLSGCAGMDRYDTRKISKLATTDGGFTWSVSTSVSMPEDSDDAEAIRLQVMKDMVRENGICPNGFEIEKRQFLRRGSSPFGFEMGDIVYHGGCK